MNKAQFIPLRNVQTSKGGEMWSKERIMHTHKYHRKCSRSRQSAFGWSDDKRQFLAQGIRVGFMN